MPIDDKVVKTNYTLKLQTKVLRQLLANATNEDDDVPVRCIHAFADYGDEQTIRIIVRDDMDD